MNGYSRDARFNGEYVRLYAGVNEGVNGFTVGLSRASSLLMSIRSSVTIIWLSE